MQYLSEVLFGGKETGKKKGLSASEYFFNADAADLTDEELEELNNKKEMMIWIHNYLWVVLFFTLICDVNNLNT